MTAPQKNLPKRNKPYRDEVGIKKFGQRLREVRREKGISQEELQRRTGFDLSQIGRIERGIVNTSVSHAFKLAKALDVPVFELFKFD